MRQPLSYQTLPCSCWVTSVVNGLLHLHGDKEKIPGLVLRLLNTVLTDEGVYSGGKKADWKIILAAIADRCDLDIRSFEGHLVECELGKVDFKKTVVICDIGAGTHSMLLIKKDGDWFLGFDPDWNQVKSGLKFNCNEFEVLPEVIESIKGSVNVRVHKDHLFSLRATKNKLFSMGGVKSRNITIISLKNKKLN